MVSIELSPEVEARFTAEAQARGISLSKLIENYLIQITPATQQMSTEEWENALDDWARDFPAIPHLSDEAISRESIYHEPD